MTRVLRPAWWATFLGLTASASGLAVLFVQALSEGVANPGLSLADGYWIGRLPWTAVGVDLAIVGATSAVVSGNVTAWLAGGPIRRIASSLTLAVTAYWWFLALLPPPRSAFCALCPPPGPDPITMAYSQPETATLFLLAPAAIAGALALSVRRTRRHPICA